MKRLCFAVVISVLFIALPPVLSASDYFSETEFGAGNGSTTFFLPDLEGFVAIGKGSGFRVIYAII